MGCRGRRGLRAELVVWLRWGEGSEACLSPGLTVMHQEGACGWQMKRDHWKVTFEVECGGDSNAARPSHLSISKPPGVTKAVTVEAHKPAVAHRKMATERHSPV